MSLCRTVIKSDLSAINIESVVMGRGIVSFVNPFSYSVLRKNPEIAEHVSLWGIDGISLQFIFSKLSGSHKRRLSFDFGSIANDVFLIAEKKNLSVYVIGSTQENVELFCNVIKNRYKNITICGYRNGYIKSESEETATIIDIKEKCANITICGMGVKKQEQFASKLVSSGWDGVAFTCGGFIHQTSSAGGDYYPAWINRYNLRFMYRIIDEPKLLKRYMMDYPVGLFFALIDLISWNNSIRKKSNA